ncbi:MAG: hypothetical protein K2Y16_01235 [Burkholderiales bacterium]|nr:hypothetical protein [Burkholderiales bacterium]MBY0521437.1 hypothetical protein [Sphingomonas sp.]
MIRTGIATMAVTLLVPVDHGSAELPRATDTPDRTVHARRNGAPVKVLGTPATKERFTSLGAEAQPGTSEELGAFIREDFAK